MGLPVGLPVGLPCRPVTGSSRPGTSCTRPLTGSGVTAPPSAAALSFDASGGSSHGQSRRLERPFGAAGRSLVLPSQLPVAAVGVALPSSDVQSRPSSCDSDIGMETLWRQQVRADMKSSNQAGGISACSRQKKSSTVLPSPGRAPSQVQSHLHLLNIEHDREDRHPLPVVDSARGRGSAARSSAFFEDLISFLEMHNLPGAYALAISAHGVQDLSQLLMLDDAALDRVLVKCELDAVDEILLKDALQRVRPGHD